MAVSRDSGKVRGGTPYWGGGGGGAWGPPLAAAAAAAAAGVSTQVSTAGGGAAGVGPEAPPFPAEGCWSTTTCSTSTGAGVGSSLNTSPWGAYCNQTTAKMSELLSTLHINPYKPSAKLYVQKLKFQIKRY